MFEICHSRRWVVLPVEWVLSIVVPVFKGKGNIRNCSCYGGME